MRFVETNNPIKSTFEREMKVMNSKVEEISKRLRMKDFEETLEILRVELESLTYEEKLSVLADVLCEEWHLITHHEFIKEVLDVFANSLK